MFARRITTTLCLLLSITCWAGDKPRVFVFTDINIDAGDPDDRQSLIHLLWYADELELAGIVPDRWNAKGYEACQLVVDAYAEDYSAHAFQEKGFPSPERTKKLLAKDSAMAAELFSAAVSDESSPLYVLVWGNMKLFQSILLQQPESAGNIRLITIGTGLMLEKDIEHMPASWEKSPPCQQLNWNGFGRNEIYDNELFDRTWWIEMNWTYAGMFAGEEPKQMFHELAAFGKMGRHMKEVVKNERWAQYFRVGDTPSVLYVIDKDHNLDDPTVSSWAGKFVKPFPAEKPNYYTDYSGSLDWNYANPCLTWDKHPDVWRVATKTLEDRRAEMYGALLAKLKRLYRQ